MCEKIGPCVGRIVQRFFLIKHREHGPTSHDQIISFRTSLSIGFESYVSNTLGEHCQPRKHHRVPLGDKCNVFRRSVTMGARVKLV